jgi:hypothetical protein
VTKNEESAHTLDSVPHVQEWRNQEEPSNCILSGDRAAGGTWRPGLGAGLAALAICTFACLGLPTTAVASRAPSRVERVAITRAAITTEGGQGLLIRVTDIRVSTAGPWAVATIALFRRKYLKKPEEIFDGTFYRDRGRWLDTNSIKTPHRTPPGAVVRDLGLAPNPSKGGGGLSTLAIIGIVVGGLILLSAIGGRSGRKSGGTSGNFVPTASFPGSQPARKEVKCPNCVGRKWENCRLCLGAGCWGCQGGRVTCQTCQGKGTVLARG